MRLDSLAALGLSFGMRAGYGQDTDGGYTGWIRIGYGLGMRGLGLGHPYTQGPCLA